MDVPGGTLQVWEPVEVQKVDLIDKFDDGGTILKLGTACDRVHEWFEITSNPRSFEPPFSES